MDEPSPSRPKLLSSLNQNYQQQNEQMPSHSDSYENYDFSDSGSDCNF